MRQYGSRLIGSGSAVPSTLLTNADLEQMVETSNDWIEQRTGIRERHVCVPEKGEGTLSLATEALEKALDDANLKGSDLDLVLVSTVTGEMVCPSTACRVAANVGAVPAGAFDIGAACPGFVYAMSVADSLIRTGRYARSGAPAPCPQDATERGLLAPVAPLSPD
ncbi:MAG: hypothetical protein ACOC0P_01865 [Planctomycetota bacterium]